MSEETKAREETQPVPQQAPAAAAKENKDQPEPKYSFNDWASI